MDLLVKYLKPLIPPIILDVLNEVRRDRSYFLGNYAAWEDACKDSTGYDAPAILDKVVDTTLKVINGEGEFERDSVLFDKPQYDWMLLTVLHKAASSRSNHLGVLDFGGSLGSVYYKNKNMLTAFDTVRWCVVDQPSFVDVGIKRFRNDELTFYHTVDECMENETINIIYVSGSLQYLRSPSETLHILLEKSVEYIVLDRIPLIMHGDRNRLTVQYVPERHCDVKISYPHWFFEKNKFMEIFASHDYALIHEFEGSIDKSNLRDTKYYGFIFRKKQA